MLDLLEPNDLGDGHELEGVVALGDLVAHEYDAAERARAHRGQQLEVVDALLSDQRVDLSLDHERRLRCRWRWRWRLWPTAHARLVCCRRRCLLLLLFGDDKRWKCVE